MANNGTTSDNGFGARPGGMKDIKDTANQAKDQVKDQAANLKDQVKDQAAQLKDQVKDLVGAGQDKFHEVKDKVMDAKDKAMDKAEGYRDQLSAKIKDSPLAAVGIAFGIGYFAMRIFRR